jgi:class 3 adenylate cyclase/tetratricopeptide (TPR) repeat protein
VVFVDIVGSTELIVGLDAEAARDRLEPSVNAMVRAVRRFDGTVIRTLGDGLKAAFGVPHTREGHALLACRAALAMQEAVAALPAPTKIRIGLHSGEVIAGTLDTGSALEQEAQGMTVHLASRIEQAAEPGTICISSETWSLVETYCDAVSIGVRSLRGIPEPVEIFRLTGLRPMINSEHFRNAGLTRLHGRDTELGVLQQALHDAGQGGVSVVGIAGPAGVGKSRLCFEFGEWCRRRRVPVLEARAHVLGQATPLLPMVDMLRAALRISPGMDPAEARQRIAERLWELDPSLADGLPLVADFLNVADPEVPLPTLDPRTRQARLNDVYDRMIKAAGRRPGVIIVEDLHWLDEASREAMDLLVESVRGTKAVMVVTFRPPWPAPWSAQDGYQELRLAELEPADTRQVVCDLVGDAPALDRVVTRVASQSGGNPFFAQELVLSLAQSGVLVGRRGQYRLGAAGWDNPVLPATVEAVVGARIDRLSEPQKEVLQIGAIIGKEFPLEVMRAVAGIAEPALQPMLDQLCASEMIQPCMTSAGASFSFRHPLIQEVVYAMQLRSRRTPLHAAVADTIKRFDWGLTDESAGLLAHHYEASGQTLEAAMHLQRAARWIGRTNSARALEDWKKVRRLMQGQPRNEANDQLRALCGGQLLTFGWREGMAAGEAKLYAEEALRYAREAGNRKHEMMLLGAYGRTMAANGAADDYVRLVQQGLALTDEVSNPEVTLLLNSLLCQAYGHAGLLSEALAASDTALRIVEDENQPAAGVVLGLTVAQMVGFDVLHWIRCLRAKLLVMLGRLDEAEASLARLIQIDPEKVEPFHQCIPHWAMVELAWHRGDAASAKSHAYEVARYAEQSAMPYVSVLASLCHGLSASIAGDLQVAEVRFREALEAARRSRAGLENEARLLALLAEIGVRAGDNSGGARTADEAIATARRHTDRYAECHATIVKAIALAAGRQTGWQPEAAELLDRAEQLIVMTAAINFRPILEDAQRAVDMVKKKCS